MSLDACAEDVVATVSERHYLTQRTSLAKWMPAWDTEAVPKETYHAPLPAFHTGDDEMFALLHFPCISSGQ